MNYTKEELEVMLFSLVKNMLSRTAELLEKSERELCEKTYEVIEDGAKTVNFEVVRALMEKYKKGDSNV